jgi:hypothetical protein
MFGVTSRSIDMVVIVLNNDDELARSLRDLLTSEGGDTSTTSLTSADAVIGFPAAPDD